MSEIMTPGAPTVIPAGYAKQPLDGGAPSLLLSASVAAADILELSGVLTAQDITVIIPLPLFPTQVVGSVSYSAPTASGWLKVVKNSTSGQFNVFLQCQGGPNTVQIPQRETFWVFSPDGINIFAASGPAGGPPVVGVLGGQSLATFTFDVVATTVNAAAVTVDTKYAPPNGHSAVLNYDRWQTVDRTAQTARSGNATATLRVFGGVLVIAGTTISGSNGDGALATAVPSFGVSGGNTLTITFTPPAAYVGTLDWLFPIHITED
jgi:hypothetical protein